MSSVEENETLVRRFLEAQAKADLDVMDKLMAPDFADRSVLPGQEADREGYMRGVAEDRAGISDFRYTIDDQVARGDKVVSRVTISGTHDRGVYMGLAPTGKEFYATGIYIHRVSGGKIAEEWSEGRPIFQMTQQQLEQEIRERERVEQELAVARRIQHALLPKALPEIAGYDVAACYRPAREVGGDFYDFFELEDGRVGVVVGDVSGKGVAAALMMANTQSVLRAVAQRGANAPGQLLAEANEVLFMYIPPNMFITCFYGMLDPSSGRLLYANAGHDLPYVRRDSGEAEELRARGMPLGLMPGMDYEEKEITLEEGESVLFYSDGLVEAHDPKGEMFGFPRLQALVAEHDDEERPLVDSLMDELHSFTGEGWEQEDDITLLTLRCSAPLS